MSLFDPSFIQKVAPALESAVNTALTKDPGSQKHLQRLKYCILEVHVTSVNKTFFFGVDTLSNKGADNSKYENKVVLLSQATSSDVQLKGSALSFIKLATYQDKSTLFKTKEIDLSGDSVRTQQIQSFMHSINVDWEGILAEFIGDIPAHALGTSLKSSFSWGKSFSQSLLRDAEEFIKYEIRLLPNKAMAKNQFINIDKLYQATENLEKRIKKRLSSMNPESKKP